MSNEKVKKETQLIKEVEEVTIEIKEKVIKDVEEIVNKFKRECETYGEIIEIIGHWRGRDPIEIAIRDRVKKVITKEMNDLKITNRS